MVCCISKLLWLFQPFLLQPLFLLSLSLFPLGLLGSVILIFRMILQTWFLEWFFKSWCVVLCCVVLCCVVLCCHLAFENDSARVWNVRKLSKVVYTSLETKTPYECLDLQEKLTWFCSTHPFLWRRVHVDWTAWWPVVRITTWK